MRVGAVELRPLPAGSARAALAGWPLPYGQPTGNRVQPQGRGAIVRTRSLVYTTPAPVRWIVSTSQGAGGALLVAVEADGSVHGMDLFRGEVRTRFRLAVQAMEEAAPVIARRRGRASILVTAATGLAVVEGGLVTQTIPLPFSPFTHPVPLDVDGDGSEEVLAVSRGGEVMLIAWGRLPVRLNVGALPDARLVLGDVDGDGRPEVVALVEPTERYPHGVLGDQVEAAALVVLRVGPQMLTEMARYRLPESAVFQGMTPLLADLDGDGVPEIVAVRSTREAGSALVAFKVTGGRRPEIRLIAEGPAMGQPSLWMHLLAAARFGTLRQPGVAAVRTPHIGGVLTLYRLRGLRLHVAAEIAGYSTHTIGSRNLDQAAAADLDGNGIPEIVVPTQDRRAVAGLEVRGGRWVEKWRHALGEPVASNFVVADLDGDGLLDLAVADAAGRLHLILSRR